MYAAWALHNLHWAPSRFAALPRKEKALVIAMIQDKLKRDRQRQTKANRGRKG